MSEHPVAARVQRKIVHLKTTLEKLERDAKKATEVMNSVSDKLRMLEEILNPPPVAMEEEGA